MPLDNYCHSAKTFTIIAMDDVMLPGCIAYSTCCYDISIEQDTRVKILQTIRARHQELVCCPTNIRKTSIDKVGMYL